MINVDCCVACRMGTFVTLAEVLEARGSPLDEDEVWCLLLATTEALLDISKKGQCYISSFGLVVCHLGSLKVQLEGNPKHRASCLIRFRQHM